MPFLIIFVCIPLIEIALFMEVGEAVGLTKTLLLCLLTAMIGAFVIRKQGLNTLRTAQNSMNKNELPVQEIFDGLCLAVAGLTLMTPGFFTDAIGFSLLLPPFRNWLRHILGEYLEKRFNIHPQPPQNEAIDVEFKRIDEDQA